MQIVEQHIIDKHDVRWSAIDAVCLLSKNLYNAANYAIRQEYIFHRRFIPYAEMAKTMKTNPDYCALPRKVSQWVLKQVDHDWKAYFAALEAWERCPNKFTGKPKLPKYKDKAHGRNLLTYTDQAISLPLLKKKGVIKPSQLDVTVKTRQRTIDQVRIVPRKSHYVVEVVYTVETAPERTQTPERIAAIDLGMNNLATVTSNQPGFVPLLVNGRPLKTINQLYNKRRAFLRSQLWAEQHTSRRIEALTNTRNRRVDAYLHTMSRRIINVLAQHQIDTLVMGKSAGWKQGINFGSKTTQMFLQIPHDRFIHMLSYKAEQVGIRVIVSEESYTSKCSFLDLEPVEKRTAYAGKRVHRGCFAPAMDGLSMRM